MNQHNKTSARKKAIEAALVMLFGEVFVFLGVLNIVVTHTFSVSAVVCLAAGVSGLGCGAWRLWDALQPKMASSTQVEECLTTSEQAKE